MRSVPEWIGKTDDAKVPARVRLRIWEKYGGVCQCGCSQKIIGKWDLDHSTALANGGLHQESNLRPLLYEHHKRKTKDDAAIASYNRKRRMANANIKRRISRPIFGSRDSGWAVHFNRGPTRR